MNFNILTYDIDSMTGRQMYDILRLRQDVFFVEEDIQYADLDDYDPLAVHVMAVAEDGGEEVLAAYARVYEDVETAHVKIGRVAVAAKYRHMGFGEAVMKAAVSEAHNRFRAHEVWLDAQIHVIGFYEKLGFKQMSEPFIEAGIEHVSMALSLPEL